MKNSKINEERSIFRNSVFKFLAFLIFVITWFIAVSNASRASQAETKLTLTQDSLAKCEAQLDSVIRDNEVLRMDTITDINGVIEYIK